MTDKLNGGDMLAHCCYAQDRSLSFHSPDCTRLLCETPITVTAELAARYLHLIVGEVLPCGQEVPCAEHGHGAVGR